MKNFNVAILLFTIVLSLVWLLIMGIRKPVILSLCRRALRNNDKNRVEVILREGMELAYLTPLDVYQIRRKLSQGKIGRPPARTRSKYLAAAFQRTFLSWTDLFWRRK